MWPLKLRRTITTSHILAVKWHHQHKMFALASSMFGLGRTVAGSDTIFVCKVPLHHVCSSTRLSDVWLSADRFFPVSDNFWLVERGVSSSLRVPCRYRTQENTRCRSEGASWCLSEWTEKKPAGLFRGLSHPRRRWRPRCLHPVLCLPASLYLANRGHHTSPGKAEPPDYFSRSSTVRVQQQQQFVQFLNPALASWGLSVQRTIWGSKKGVNVKLVPSSAYNHGCSIVLYYTF